MVSDIQAATIARAFAATNISLTSYEAEIIEVKVFHQEELGVYYGFRLVVGVIADKSILDIEIPKLCEAIVDFCRPVLLIQGQHPPQCGFQVRFCIAGRQSTRLWKREELTGWVLEQLRVSAGC